MPVGGSLVPVARLPLVDFGGVAFASYIPMLGYALAALFGLEIVYVLLRRGLHRFRPRLTYHLWALAVAALCGLAATPLAEPGVTAWDAAIGVVAVLSTLIGFALFEALILVRPWDPRRGAFLPKLARDVVRLMLVTAVALAVAHVLFHRSLSSVLVASTASVAVLGLALQDLLKNVFAGMSLQMEKPFRTGDWLLLDGRLARVLDVSWRSTRLRTNEGVEIFEPNSAMAAGRLVNYGSGREPVAFNVAVGLPYETPPAEAKAVLLQAARSTPGIAETPEPEVFVDHFGDSAIGYRMRVWTKEVSSATRFQDAVHTRVWYQLQRRGIAIPFPTRTVLMHDNTREVEQGTQQDLRNTADLLARLPLLKELTREAIEHLAGAARRQVFDNGEELVKEGETGDSLFVLERGRVQVTKSGTAVGTSYVVLARLKAGDFFGEMSLLTGEPRSATITADGSCEVLVLDRDAVSPVLAADPTIAETLSKSLAARAAATSATLEDRRDRGREDDEPAVNLLHRIRAFFSLPD